jgi:hypothetical protein
MAANMLGAMNAELLRMNRATSDMWTALVDSLRQDLIRMSAMNAPDLVAFMPTHRTRMTRLIQMRETMMKG